MTRSERHDLWLRIGVAVLLFALFFQCGQYVVLYRRLRQRTEVPRFDMRSLSLTARQVSSDFDLSLLLPDVIAIRMDGNSVAVRGAEAVVEDVFRASFPALRAALDGTAELKEETIETFEQYLKQDDVLFLHFSSELPVRVVASFAGTEFPAGGDVFGIKEFMLLPDVDGRITLICFRGSSAVWTASVAPSSSVTKSAYESIAAQYSDVFTICDLVPAADDVTVIFRDRVLVRQLMSGGSTVYLFRQVTNDLDSFLRLFSFNPDKLNVHSEPDGTYTCVESHGILRIGNTGVWYIANESGGVSLSGLSGASDERERDEEYYLHICSFLIDFLAEMDRAYVGGDARLCLESVSSEREGTVTFRFRYRSDNIPLRLLAADGGTSAEETEQGLTVTFSGDRLMDFSLYMLTVQKAPQYVYTAVSEWVADYLGSGTPDGLWLMYTLNGWQPDAVTAEWIVSFPDDTQSGSEATR